MRISRGISRLLVGLGLAVASAVASAQGPVSTGLAPAGSTDPAWQISLNGGSYYDAYVLSRTPSVPGVYQWIGATAGGSVPGGSPDGNFLRDTYSFRTSFVGTGLLSVDYQCAYDDAFAAMLLNGVAVGTGCDAYTPGATRTLTGFVPGTNTLQIAVSGNGITDGLAFNVVSVDETPDTTVPEPASLSLLGAGLAALLGVSVWGRSRRTS